MTQKKPQLKGADVFFSQPQTVPRHSAQQVSARKKTPPESVSKSHQDTPVEVEPKPSAQIHHKRVRMALLSSRIPEAYVDLVERLYLEKRLAGNQITKAQIIVDALKQAYGDPTRDNSD